MISTFYCPCCGADNWNLFKRYSFYTEKLSDTDLTVSCEKYRDIRRQILFNIWFKNDQSIYLTSQYCGTCGFICYSPRPTEEDLQAKYLFLEKKESIGALHSVTDRALKLDKRRENFMFNVLNTHRTSSGQNVLDVGGGDGRLMRPFLKHHYECYVVDYNKNPHPGIQRLGATIDDIQEGMLFDIIICSHVLEHVSDPGNFLSRLRSLLTQRGIIYIEVPLEVWKGIAISNDPVTHINFFTVDSLKNALLLNGLNPLSIQKRLATYGETYKRVILSVATTAESKNFTGKLGIANTKRLLQPSLLDEFFMKMENYWLKYVLNRY